jgi:hypothetical protein
VTTRRGFRYDSGRSRLEVIVDGTVVAVFNNIAPSLSLTAPLEVGSGGTGVSSLNDHYVLVGSDTDAVTPVTPSTSGFVLTSNGTGSDPSFQVASAGHSLGMAMVVGG